MEIRVDLTVWFVVNVDWSLNFDSQGKIFAQGASWPERILLNSDFSLLITKIKPKQFHFGLLVLLSSLC